jgi:hypothetical protein
VVEDGGSAQAAIGSHRQQDFYWKQMIELKALSIYIRLYRDEQANWVKRVGIIKGLAASSTIPGWVFFQKYVFIWGLVIAAAQVIDSLKEVFPHAKRQQEASNLHVILEQLFTDAQFEWENIFAAKFSDDDIMLRRKKLAQRQLAAEKAHFPGGIAPDKKRGQLADNEAKDYFSRWYGV